MFFVIHFYLDISAINAIATLNAQVAIRRSLRSSVTKTYNIAKLREIYVSFRYEISAYLLTRRRKIRSGKELCVCVRFDLGQEFDRARWNVTARPTEMKWPRRSSPAPPSTCFARRETTYDSLSPCCLLPRCYWPVTSAARCDISNRATSTGSIRRRGVVDLDGLRIRSMVRDRAQTGLIADGVGRD